MNSLTFSNGDYTAAVSYANQLASSTSGTVTSNVNFWLLLAVGSTIIGIIYILLRCLVRFGRSYAEKRRAGSVDNMPLTAFDSLGEAYYAGYREQGMSDKKAREWADLDMYGMPRKGTSVNSGNTWASSTEGRHWIRSYRARGRKARKIRMHGGDLNSKKYKRATAIRVEDLPF